jgi:pyridoxamine 5'-phosphate oxidase
MIPTTTNPIALFQTWFDEAHHCGLSEPDAMTIATATKQGIPSTRIVLLRHVDEHGFVFYTNLTSKKGTELQENPYVSLNFHWMPLKKQVRVEGIAQQVSDEEADRYFANRVRGSQISAWASKQSEEIEYSEAFAERVENITQQYAEQPLPRPPFWSGFRIVPYQIEFWQERPFRMHEREIYQKTIQGWEVGKYYP